MEAVAIAVTFADTVEGTVSIAVAGTISVAVDGTVSVAVDVGVTIAVAVAVTDGITSAIGNPATTTASIVDMSGMIQSPAVRCIVMRSARKEERQRRFR